MVLSNYKPYFTNEKVKSGMVKYVFHNTDLLVDALNLEGLSFLRMALLIEKFSRIT